MRIDEGSTRRNWVVLLGGKFTHVCIDRCGVPQIVPLYISIVNCEMDPMFGLLRGSGNWTYIENITVNISEFYALRDGIHDGQFRIFWPGVVVATILFN